MVLLEKEKILLLRDKMKKGFILIWGIALTIILIVGVFLFFLGNSNSGDKTIMHKDFRALIQSDWQEFEISSLFLYLPPNISLDDENAEVISIAIAPWGDNQFSLDELLEQGIANSKQVMPDFEITEEINAKINNLDGKRIKFIGTSEGVKRNYIQYFGIEYNKVYVLTYFCPIDNCNSYEIYNKVVKSFEPIES